MFFFLFDAWLSGGLRGIVLRRWDWLLIASRLAEIRLGRLGSVAVFTPESPARASHWHAYCI